MDILKYISADDEIRAIADLRQKTINDYNSEMTVALETGREEGREEGRIEAMREMARNLLQNNVEINMIATVSGLSVEEIESLASG